MKFIRLAYKNYDVTMFMNGILGGLVAMKGFHLARMLAWKQAVVKYPIAR